MTVVGDGDLIHLSGGELSFQDYIMPSQSMIVRMRRMLGGGGGGIHPVTIYNTAYVRVNILVCCSLAACVVYGV